MSAPAGVIFLSYASEDADAASRIADALKNAGMDVFFDRSELRGGDAWDQKIRQQIRACRLFIPIISANTDSRAEGYFRREWRLALDRSQDISERISFVVPVVIDDTPEPTADVPDSFRAVQWTRLIGGVAPPTFVARIVDLLAEPQPGAAPANQRVAGRIPAARGTRNRAARRAGLLFVALLAAAAAAWLLKLYVFNGTQLPKGGPQRTAVSPAFDPPVHSVAVLPFANLSGDPDQVYFSDGLAEDILDSLAHVRSLQVAAKTSAFALRNSGLDVPNIARRLNVGAVLEGSVRRSGQRVRITTQLIDARTGYYLWSQSFDQNFTDALTIQSTIARQVAAHLDSELSGLSLAKLGEGSTRNIDAYDTFLQGIHILSAAVEENDFSKAAEIFQKATQLDPQYAAAFTLLAHARTVQTVRSGDLKERRRLSEAARVAADRAVALAPDLAEAYATRGFVHAVALLDFGDAADFDRAIALAPANALVLARMALYLGLTGRTEEGLVDVRRAIELDPLNASWRHNLVIALTDARRYDAALAALAEYQTVFGLRAGDYLVGFQDVIYLQNGEAARARQLCLPSLDSREPRYQCLAIASQVLGDHAAAEHYSALSIQRYGDRPFYQAEICAQLGRTREAITWLQRAITTRDPPLQHLRTSTFLDPIRDEAEYQAMERELHFPPLPNAAR